MTELTGTLTGNGVFDLGNVGPWRVAYFHMTVKPDLYQVIDAGTPDRLNNLGWVQPADSHFDGTAEGVNIAYGDIIWLNFTDVQWVVPPNNAYFQLWRFRISPGGSVDFDLKS